MTFRVFGTCSGAPLGRVWCTRKDLLWARYQQFYFTLLLSRLLPALPDAAGAELCAHRRYSAEQGQFRFKSLYPIETTIRVPH